MHYINGSYTNYINRRRKKSGYLFQGRYKAVLVDVHNYLIELSRYIHLNPVRAKMVKKPEDYTYSSYKSYISKKKEETSHRKDPHIALVSEQIIDAIASYFELSPEEALRDRGECRNIAIHLMKRWTSIINKRIGDIFGGLTLSAV